MSDKEYKSIDEQIAILEKRGLGIPDKEKARQFLARNNYYRVSGYSLTLRSHDVFHKNASFQNIIDIYSFDHELRHILLRHLDTIEVTVKSVFAHEFSKRHGPIGYISTEFFIDEVIHREIMDKAKKQIELRLPHEAYLKHFIEELKQDIPLWAFVDLLTIRDISLLFKISENDVQEAVAEEIGLQSHRAELLKRFMHSMTILRNLCAHGSRLYNRMFEQMPWLNKEEKRLLRRTDNGEIDNSHLFGFILLMKRLLLPEDYYELKQDIYQLTKKYPFVRLRYYGFPDNWYDVT